MKIINLKLLSVFLSVAILLGSVCIKLDYNVYAYDKSNEEASKMNDDLSYNIDSQKASDINKNSHENFFPYNVHFDFFEATQHIEVMSFNAGLRNDGTIVFTDFFSYGGVFNENFTIKIYNTNGKKIFEFTIMAHQFTEYWGKLLFDKLNQARIPVDSYFQITGIKSAKARINGYNIDTKKDYIFKQHGVLETNSGAMSFNYPASITLGENYTFTARYVRNGAFDGRVVFEKGPSSTSLIMYDNYDITIYDFNGNVKYTHNIYPLQPIMTVDLMLDELNRIKVEFSDYISIKGMNTTSVKINDAIIDPEKNINFWLEEYVKRKV